MISSFTVTAPNGEEITNLTVKQGEQINFRWQLTGDLATQLTLTPNIGDVLGRNSKIITTSATGQFIYTLTATNGNGSATRQVTVNVLPPDPPTPPETLYNGIALPAAWPPTPVDYPTALQPPAYLTNPPTTIPINVGRQLLVDDFLIESTTLTREFHAAQVYPGNPVLTPTTAMENSGLGPMAMPFSNGVFYDPADSLFKVWYMCGYRQSLCYATSTDGTNWNRPALDVVPGTNIVMSDSRPMDGYTTWIDLEETIPARRYKLLRVVFNGTQNELHLHYSADGIHWASSVAINRSLPGDRSTFFYNPFRKVWALSLREVSGVRLRRYFEHKDLTFALNAIVSSNPSSAERLFTDISKWLKSDSADTAHPADPTFTPQMYDIDAAPYESLMLGQMAILRGNANKPTGRPKLNEVYFGFSRDGFNWQRPNRQAMFTISDTSGSWNWGSVQPVGGGPIIVGDQLYFYFSARGGLPKGGYVDAGGAMGLATMRRDGFASMNAGNSESTLTTRPVSFNGKFLFVNAEIAAGGSLCAEVLDQNNQVIAPFSKANCQPFSGDTTKQMIAWAGANDLSALANAPVKFRFYLKNGKLYSFWISPNVTGISRGFVGAGGPEFGKYVDDGSTPPPTSLLTPPAQTVTSGQTVTLNYQTKNADTVTLTPAIGGCIINANASGTCSFTASTNGTTTYTLTATRGGQMAKATASVTVNSPDTQPPTVAITAPAITSTDQATITLTGTAQDNTGVTQVNFGSDKGASGAATATGGPAGFATWTATVPLQLGVNVITFTAQDAAGNAGTAQITITRTQAADTTPPVVTITAPTQNAFPLGTKQVSITATTNEPASCRFAPITVGPGIYVAPNGSPSNDGSFARPLDLATALSSASPAKPGDTLWLRGGSYILPGAPVSNTEEPPFRSVLTGTAALPITVRQFPGERASVEGGIRVEGAYVNYRDFEITNSNTNREDPRPAGMNVFGHHIKLINLVIHEAGNGIGFWVPAEESEIYGALLFHNGWDNINGLRGNGHGIYAQNLNGTKRITDVISFDNYATGMKAYTEQSYANNIRFEGNIIFNNGRPARVRGNGDRIENLLIGAQVNPVVGSVVINNYLYHPLTSFGEGIRIGYLSPTNNDILFKDNYVVSGSPSLGRVTHWNNATLTGNTIIGESELLRVELPAGGTTSGYAWNNNQYWSRTNPLPFTFINGAAATQTVSFAGWQQATGLDAGSQLLGGRPNGAKVFVRPNQYQPGRYHIAVYNWDLQSQVSIDASSLLNAGERFEVRNAQDYFGVPALAGVYNGGALQLPMNGTPTGPEFNAFVLISLDRQPQSPVMIPAFNAMTTFSQTGAQSHAAIVNTQDGQSYNLAIQCSDAVGNTSAPQIISFSIAGTAPPPPPVDTLPPAVAINGASNLPTTQTSIILTGTAQDNVGVTQVSYNNDRGPQGAASGTGSWTATVALELGENAITVQARDAAGNIGSALVTVVRNAPADTQAPTVAITPPASLSVQQTSITLTGTAQDNVGVTQVSFTTDRAQQGTATGTNAWSAAVPLALGQNVVTIRAQDAAGNAGTAQITITRTDPAPPPANANRAISFDGRTGYIALPASDVGLYTKFWSLEAWINTTSSAAAFQGILGNNEGNDLLLSQGKALVSCYSGGFTVFYGTRTVNDGNWHHLVAVRDNDKLYLYIDGQPDTDSESHQPFKTLRALADNNFNLKAIGTRGRLADWYQGLVDDVRAYGRALTAAEVLAHYNNGAGIPSAPDTGLRMAYNFDEEAGNALDFSGNNKAGTLTGGVTRVLRNGGSPPPPPTPPTITSFTVAVSGQAPGASATITLGQSVTLAWQIANAQSASISGTLCNVSPLASGVCQHTPSQTGQFTLALTAQGASATATATVSVTVNAPPPPPPPDTQPPAVVINTPTTTTTQQPSITLTGAAQDNVGVTGLIYQTDQGQQGQPSGVSPWSATVPLAVGTNIVIVRAQDAAGNFGSAQISITRTSPPPPNNANQAMQFDGFTGYVATQRGDAGVQTRFWTIEAWVKTNSTRIDYMTLVGNGSGNDLRMASGQMILSSYNSAFTHFISRRRVNDGQWHHVVALRDGDRLAMYIDGQLEYAQSDTAQQGFINIYAPSTANNFSVKALGNRGTPSEWYAGSLDDVRLYTRALSASEVLAHYNNGQGIPSAPDAGLLAGFDFNEASGTALDFSGNGRSGTPQGAATRVVH